MFKEFDQLKQNPKANEGKILKLLIEAVEQVQQNDFKFSNTLLHEYGRGIEVKMLLQSYPDLFWGFWDYLSQYGSGYRNMGDSEIQNTLNKDGVIVLKNFIDAETVKSLRNELEKQTALATEHITDEIKQNYEHHRYYVGPEVDGKSINIGSPYDARVQISYRKEELAPDCIKALFNHERLNHIVGDYTGGLTKPQDVMMEKISPPLMFRDNDWWHIDNLADHFKAQLILNDMDINDGPFKFIKGTHKNFSAKQKARYHKMYALQGIKTQESNHFEDEFTTPELCTEFVANAGDIALFDPKLHHSWRYPYDNGERNNIFIYYIKIPTLKNKILGRIDQYLNFK